MRIVRPLTRRAYVMLGTLLTISCIIIGYFNFYLPNREEKLIKQKGRVLTQVARNFESKWEVFKKNAVMMEKDASEYLSLEIVLGVSTKLSSYPGHEIENILEGEKIDSTIHIEQNGKSMYLQLGNMQETKQKLSENEFNLNDSIQILKHLQEFDLTNLIFWDTLNDNYEFDPHPETLEELKKAFAEPNAFLEIAFKDKNLKEPNAFLEIKSEYTPNLKRELSKLINNSISDYRTRKQEEFLKKGNNSSLEVSFLPPKRSAFTFLHRYGTNEAKSNTSQSDQLIKNSGLYIFANLASFLKPLLETEDFDGFFLYREQGSGSKNINSGTTQEVVFQSLSGDLYAEQTFLNNHPDQKNKTEKVIAFSLYNPDQNQGKILNAQLNGTAYKLFDTSFKTVDVHGNDIKWHLVGLMDQQHFDSERRSVPPTMIISYSLSLLLILFGLPLLKLLFMSRIEQLTTSNFVRSCLSGVLCTSLLIIILLGLNTYAIHENNRIDGSLQAIADSLDKALESEVGAMYQATAKWDSAESFTSNLTKNPFNSLSLAKLYSLDEQDKKTSVKPQYLDFDILFWMNDKGDILREYSTIKTEDHFNSLNLKERQYYKEIINQTAWKRPKDKKEFYIQSIQSWDKGEKSCVLSIKSSKAGMNGGPVVVGIQKQLNSLFYSILPTGYKFQVTDETGLVLFHSDEQRNLQENLLAECEHNAGLTAAMISNTALFTDIEYKHYKNRSYIKPLNGVPWYLVVSYDKRYSSIPLSLIVAYTLISCIFIACTLCILFIITTKISRRPSRLAKSKLNINWLRPKQENHGIYSKAVRINIVTIILLVLYNLHEEVISYQSFTIFLITITLLYTSLYYKFLKKVRPDLSVYLCLSIAAIILFIQWFLYEITIFEIIYLSIFLALLYLSVFTDILFGAKSKVETNAMTRLIDGPTFRESYTKMLFTFLLICAVLPATFLFSKLYQEEQLIWKKHALFELNKKVLAREKALHQKYQIYTTSEKGQKLKSRLVEAWQGKGAYYKAAGLELKECITPDCFINEPTKNTPWSYASLIKNGRSDHYLLSVFQKARPNITGLVTETNGFLYNQGYNAKWSHVYQEVTERSFQHSVKKNRMHIHINNQPFSTNAINVASPVPSLLDGTHNIANLILIFLILFFLYFIYLAISYILKTYFSWNLFTLSETLVLSDDEYIKNNHETCTSRVFFVTSPYSHKKALEDFTPLDFTQIDDPDVLDIIYKELKGLDESTKVLLQNFSYNPQSTEAWNKKLTLLEKLVASTHKIAIQSNFRPLQIYEVYENRIHKTEQAILKSGSNNEQVSPRIVDELNEALDRWKDILSTFHKIYLTPTKGESQNETAEPGTIKSKLECLLNSEKDAWPEYFSWIPEYKTILFKYATCQLQKHQQQNKPGPKSLQTPKEEVDPAWINEIKEEIILKIQSMAQSFYFSLWNNCSMEEKYVLYDLAKDGFINPKARNQLYLLMEKGLIYQDESDQLHIRNKSFRNFILTNIKKSEAVEIEKQVAQTGTYSIMKASVIVIAVASVGFIAFTNQGHLQNLVALLTGLAAIIPTVLRMGGWFGTNEGSKG